MRRRARPNAAPLPALVLVLLSLACSAPPEASPPPSRPRATSAEAPRPPAESEHVLRLGATFPPPESPMFEPPRLIEAPAACSGPALRLDADLGACRCGEPGVIFEPDGRLQYTAGKSCGLPHADEQGPPPRLTLEVR